MRRIGTSAAAGIPRKKTEPLMSQVSSHSARELTLAEMLADPIVQKLMARDGVSKQHVEILIAEKRLEFQEINSPVSAAMMLVGDRTCKRDLAM